MKQIYQFLGYFNKRRTLIAAHLLLQAAISVVLLAVPEVLRIATNAMTSSSTENLNRAAVLAAVATLLYILFTLIDKPLETHVKNKCAQDMQNAVIKQMLRLKRLELAKYSSGDIITKVTQNTTEAVERSLSVVFDIFTGICLTVAGVIYMGRISFRLTAIIVPYFILIKIFVDWLYKKVGKKSQQNVSVTKQSNTFLINVLNNINVIRAFSRREYFAQKLQANENKLMKINVIINVLYWASFYVTLAMTKVSQYGIVYALGGYWVYQGIISLGAIVAFASASGSLEKGMRPLMNGISSVAIVLPHIENIMALLNSMEGCEDEKGLLVQGDASIVLDDVSFSFSTGENRRQIFEHVSFSIARGEKIMLRGENGKGKSTLLRLIAGLYRPEEGKVIIGGQNTTDVSIDSIAEKCCYISQTSDIMEGGVYENLALSEDYDDELCHSVLDTLNMGHVAAHEPETLSQGEKQRLNIGRALYKSQKFKSADIILGDEIFSNVDQKNKEMIISAFFKELQDKTVVLVCHDDMPYKFDHIVTVGENGVEVMRG